MAAPPPVHAARSGRAQYDTSDDARSEDRPPEEHEHRGFFLRSFVGLGYRTATERSDGGDFRVSGVGGALGLQIGGAVARNVVIHGDLFYEEASNPTFKTAESSTKLDGGRLTFAAFGPGVSYYVMPANVHFGVSLLLCRMSFGTEEETLGKTDWGYGAAFRLGKDFWLSRALSLGAFGQVAFAHMNDGEDAGGVSRKVNSTTATLAFSGSYH